MATKTKKAVAKKTATKAKTIPIRSKDKKKLAGSISLGGKKAPTVKKAAVKKATVSKAGVTKASTPSIPKIVIKNAGKPTTATPKSFTPVAKKVFAPLPEIEENDIDTDNNGNYTLDTYLQDITPLPKDFVSSFSVEKFNELNTSRGVAWTADILRDGVKVGTAENNGDGGAHRYEFIDSETRDAWENEAAEAYADTWHENQDEEDTLFDYLDLMSNL